jgi:hypothetical protein
MSINTQVEILKHKVLPIYTLVLPDRVSDEDVKKYLLILQQCVDAGIFFGAVFHYVAGSPKKSKEAQKLESNWIKANKLYMSNYCLGIGMVPSRGVHGLIQRIVLKGFGYNLFGCECRMFSSASDAEAWLVEKINSLNSK